ncbi:hypothetical protein ACJJTC_012400 [Scirpophaga incertulas]
MASILSKRQIYRNVTKRLHSDASEVSNAEHISMTDNGNNNTGSSRMQIIEDSESNYFFDTAIEASNIAVGHSNENLYNVNNLSDTHFSLSDSPIPVLKTSSKLFDSNMCCTDASIVHPDLPSFLREWTIKYNITNAALTALLKHLKVNHSDLVTDARSLMNGKTKYNVKVLKNGEYIHIGIEKSLLNFMSTKKNINNIKLTFNIDGLPLFHSSNVQFWPILADIANFKDSTVFVIGIFCGNSKPDPLDIYLEDFIQELDLLVQNGLLCNDRIISVSVHCFVCDMPARSFLKNVKSHNGYSSCDKCICHGDYVHNRIVLNDLNSPLRTDESFSLQSDEDHHVGISPLTKLPIGLVSSFPIDYMHSMCLGVMRKLLHSWVKPTKSEVKKVKMDSRKITIMNERLSYLRQFIPNDFNRKPRSVQDLDRWKATEFRTFLLYIGPVVMYRLLETSVYNHFLILHAAISILVSNKLANKFSCYAKYLLKEFVKDCIDIYGEQYLVYNVHSLIHLGDDVDRYGVLDNISAFKFENFLGTLKKISQDSKQTITTKINDKCMLYGQQFKTYEDYFTYPCSSKHLQIYLVSELSQPILIDAAEVMSKCVMLPYFKKFVVLPLKHT